MTNEQLDEIEKLARDPKSAAFHDLMARQAIPLVKALREARERDEGYFKSMEAYRLDVEDCRRRMGDLLDQCAKEQADAHQFRKERDEARAEVERLSAVVQQVHALAATEERDYRCVRVVEKLREIHKITKGTSDV